MGKVYFRYYRQFGNIILIMNQPEEMGWNQHLYQKVTASPSPMTSANASVRTRSCSISSSE